MAQGTNDAVLKSARIKPNEEDCVHITLGGGVCVKHGNSTAASMNQGGSSLPDEIVLCRNVEHDEEV